MNRRALIICNGEPPSRVLAVRLAAQSDIVIAADGGANTARGFAITPDVIIGDLDSVTPSTKKFFAPSTIIKVKTQYSTDLEKALNHLETVGIREVSIIGATGRRIDFTFANMSVIWNYVPGIRCTFFGDGWRAMPVESGNPVVAKPGTTVSLIPLGLCSGITLKGLKYPLTNARMKVGEIGVSNVVKKSPFTVTVRRGRMMMFILDRT